MEIYLKTFVPIQNGSTNLRALRTAESFEVSSMQILSQIYSVQRIHAQIGVNSLHKNIHQNAVSPSLSLYGCGYCLSLNLYLVGGDRYLKPAPDLQHLACIKRFDGFLAHSRARIFGVYYFYLPFN